MSIEAPWYKLQPRCVKQKVEKKAQKLFESDLVQSLYEKYILNRSFWFALLLPIVIVWISWIALSAQYNLWYLGEQGWKMSLTMVFGAFVAGSTTLGGGAVAFPVMVLVLQATPTVGRDFSLLIQSIGMVAAAWNILYSEVKVDFNALLWCSIGGVIGVFIGFAAVVPAITQPIYVTFFFVAFWMSFSVSLFMHNSRENRAVFETIQNVDWSTRLVLVIVGVLGGICSAMTGSGVDICSFALLTTYFSLNEQQATPTSVCLMGINTVVATIARAAFYGPLEQEAQEFVWFSIPIVVGMAPFGSFVASFLHRRMLALWVYILTFVQVVSAFAVLTYEIALVWFSIGVFISGVVMWLSFVYFGIKRAGATPESPATTSSMMDVRTDVDLEKGGADAEVEKGGQDAKVEKGGQDATAENDDADATAENNDADATAENDDADANVNAVAEEGGADAEEGGADAEDGSTDAAEDNAAGVNV